MALAEREYGEKLGLHTYQSKWGVGQLLYLDLNWSDIDQFIDFDRMNWDSTFASDFATLSSILNTNRIPCASWQEVKRILNVYEKSWKTRFLVSLLCEGLGKVGFLGKPLYYSELLGYQSGTYATEGLLDTIDENPEIGFDAIISRIFDKMSDNEAREMLREILASDQRNLVYPFLLDGSTAWASFRKLEKVGGKDTVIDKTVPAEVCDEVYMMLISTTSNLFFFGPKPKLFSYDELFSRIHIKELTYFGADTSIRTSPHFYALQAEMGHFIATPAGQMREIMDAMFRGLRALVAADKELTFDKVTDSSPPEMHTFLESHKRKKLQERAKSSYTISSDWLRRLRTEDF